MQDPARRQPFPDEADDRPVDPLESTSALISRVRDGDARASDRLAERYTAALRRWAHGRLPIRARDLVDTDDLVQSALYRALSHLDHFEHRGSGSFLAYARQIILNQIRDEARRVSRRPEHTAVEEHLAAVGPSPLEQLIRSEQLDRYEGALGKLNASQREAVVMRLELGFRYREIAEAMGLPSGNAARLMIARALVHLSRAMRDIK